MRGPARLFPPLLTLGLLAACGPLPRPFMHDGMSPLVENHRSLSPISVGAVEGMPSLAPALVKALEKEDIAATTEPAGQGVLRLEGQVSDRQIVWSLTDGDRVEAAWLNTPIDKPTLALAESTAKAISHKLRGEDSGLSDMEGRPHIALRVISVPREFDGPLLVRAMTNALALKGVTISDDKPVARIEVTVTATAQGGNDLVEITWKIFDAHGESLGTVSQSSPVPHGQLIDPMSPVPHDIAVAGAPGVAEVISKRVVGHNP